jgi:hypothetical protein
MMGDLRSLRLQPGSGAQYTALLWLILILLIARL